MPSSGRRPGSASANPRMPGRLLTILTDFGTSDAYVAAVKGVMLGLNPELTVIDITHDVAPQDVPAAAFLLGAAAPYFPRGTVHVAVVDPGVGTERRPLLVLTPDAAYVGPDNGIFSSVLAAHSASEGEGPLGGVVPLSPDVRAFHLTNSRYWRQPVSRTFHARDIFGPVAAHLTLGVSPEQLGEPVESIRWLPPATLRREQDGLAGQVVHVDRFGNLVTNIPEEVAGRLRTVWVAGRSIVGLSETYASAGDDLMALVGSYGTIEIAVRNGSAAAALGVGVGERVIASIG